MYKTVYDIQCNREEYKVCSSCISMNLKTNDECWWCKGKNFNETEDDVEDVCKNELEFAYSPEKNNETLAEEVELQVS